MVDLSCRIDDRQCSHWACSRMNLSASEAHANDICSLGNIRGEEVGREDCRSENGNHYSQIATRYPYTSADTSAVKRCRNSQSTSLHTSPWTRNRPWFCHTGWRRGDSNHASARVPTSRWRL